jgi:twinkle protein
LDSDSELISKGPCPDCGSSDACAAYTDGHTHCFSCGKHRKGDGSEPQRERKPVSGRPLIEGGEVQALVKRKLSEETCKKWGYHVGEYKDRKVQIANYRDADGHVVAQKVRFPDKTFTITGDLKDALPLYGQWLWRDGGKMVVVTEGEIDALTVSQLQSLKWPVVSIPNGAQGATKAVAKALDWLLKFESVVFMFDNDEPGRDAAKACAAILPPGRAKIATLPLKDASDMLMAGRGGEVIDAMWGAKECRPDGVVSLKDIREKVMTRPETGLPWCLEALTKLTYGRRYGELYFLGAGTGVGKTDFLTQQMAFDVQLGQAIGVFSFEQSPAETGKRIAGKIAGKRFHIPDGDWTDGDLTRALDDIDGSVYLYDHFGVCDYDVVEASIRYMVHAYGVRIFYLDHLTAFAAGAEDERKELERIMGALGGLVKELGIILIAVSHLATPEGKSHEEGGRVMIRHFKGSRSIGFWSHFMFGMERDQQAEDDATRTTTTFRILKDRHTGNSTGEVFYLGYDKDTGRLFETDAPGASNNHSTGGSNNDDF